MKIDYIPRYTYSDYTNWEGRWELIDGLPYAMSPLPIIKHQKINGKIHHQLLELLDNCEKCIPLLPVDWKLDDNTVVQPDNSVVCGEVGEKYLTEPPVMIFEILSPSTAFKDVNIKYKIYESQTVKYYIIIDIDNNIAKCFHLKDNKYKKYAETHDDVITFDLGYCEIDFNFKTIWII